jgi:hypothetical protein
MLGAQLFAMPLTVQFSSERWLFALLLFSRVGSAFHPSSNVGVKLQFTVYAFSFA